MKCWATSHLNGPGKLIGVLATRSVYLATSGILLWPIRSQLLIEIETSMRLVEPVVSMKNTRQ